MNHQTQSWVGLLSAVSVLWALAGCESARRPEPVPEAAAVKRMPSTAESGIGSDTPSGARHSPATIEVIVEEGTGMVVVNRQPVGLAPQRVRLAVTPQGFLEAPVAVAVRFVAHDESEASFSVEEVLEVTDRPPTRLVFTREGVRREFDGML